MKLKSPLTEGHMRGVRKGLIDPKAPKPIVPPPPAPTPAARRVLPA